MSSESNLKGVGGWLAFLVICQTILGPLLNTAMLGAVFLEIETLHPTLASSRHWQEYERTSWLLFFVLTGCSIWAGINLWINHQRSSVKYMIFALWGLPVAYVAGQFFIINNIYPGSGTLGIFVHRIGMLITSFIGAGVWTAYLKKSVRVRNTYGFASVIISEIERTAPQRIDAGIATETKYESVRNQNGAQIPVPYPSDADVESDFNKLVRHSNRIAATYATLEKLPDELKREFRHALHNSKDPIQDAEQVAKVITGKHLKLLNPFESEEANQCLKQCRAQFGEEAAREFEAIYKRLGPSADPSETLEKFAANKLQTIRNLARLVIAKRSTSDAKELLARLGGTIEYQQHKIVVYLEGETETFEYEYGMVLWIVNNVAPKYA